MKIHAPKKIVLFSHDSVGLGHVRRNLALARAFTEAADRDGTGPVTGLLVTGEPVALKFPLPRGWEWLVIPGITKSGSSYGARRLDVPFGDLTQLRGRIVRGALLSFGPDLVVVDRHPYGVRQELAPALRDLKRERPETRIVLGMREVLDEPARAAKEWAKLDLDQFCRDFDQIWVYGDPRVHDPVESGEIPAAVSHLVRHTGYLSAGRAVGRSPRMVEQPYVVSMFGGGSDAFELAELAARTPVPEGFEHLVVTGPQMPSADFRRVQAAAGPHVQLHKSVPDGLACLREASAAVLMGGYNTMCELLSSHVPALVVPRTSPRTEQLIRATALERHGAVSVLEPEAVSPDALARWFTAATTGQIAQSGGRSAIDGHGLDAVVRLTAALLSPHDAPSVSLRMNLTAAVADAR
ncbi:glycosyl transferase family 28 [Pseudoclavibacter sp. RFBG4]|uniref:glycosyltransferase family protein n=1 Tax=Pseudoclavibacter sp. RFBG4 TaxID=2080575 RepID=UPI000CE8DA72|nr:glycosyltransferase [Pseudoclavibacter sp. RFBG4]PPG35442.1 glycosyl transferase family 28 [Pseudoclavibacter sp. RFBG4]